MNISDLAIEVTRRCNMSCEHCLRGDAQNMDLDLNIVDNFFSYIGSIGTLTITGGEPSLVPHIISSIFDLAKTHNVSIDNWYMVTNAKEVSDDFMKAVLKAYMYTHNKYDEGISSLDISNDIFHEEVDPNNIVKLQAFQFTRMKFSKDDYDYERTQNILFEGRAKKNFYTDREVDLPEIEYCEDSIDTLLYLNCKGNILPDCNLSYDHQDEKDLIICNVRNEFNLIKSIRAYNKRVEKLKLKDAA